MECLECESGKNADTSRMLGGGAKCLEFGSVMVPTPSFTVGSDAGDGNPTITGRINVSNDKYDSAANDMSNTR